MLSRVRKRKGPGNIPGWLKAGVEHQTMPQLLSMQYKGSTVKIEHEDD